MAARKKFIDVEIPLLNTEMQVLGTLEELDKKTIKLELTRKLRGKGCEVHFKILANDKTLVAHPKKIQLMKFYIRRMIRKRISYVEDSIKVQCKDISATIKPFLITRKRVSRVVRKNLRNTAKEIIVNYVKDKTYLEICDAILSGTMQKDMLPRLKKVYPLSFCDLRIFETNEIEKADLTFIKTLNTEEIEITQKEDSDELSEETKPEKTLEKEEDEETLEKEVKEAEAPKKKSIKKAKKTSKKEE